MAVVISVGEGVGMGAKWLSGTALVTKAAVPPGALQIWASICCTYPRCECGRFETFRRWSERVTILKLFFQGEHLLGPADSA